MFHIDGEWVKDDQGRTVLWRGVNLGGSSKVPTVPDGATYRREGFFDHRNVSFVGRPFPLEEADEHYARLREWGLTFLRFLVTWEAVEHAGPGIYDEEYLDYLEAVVAKARRHGLTLFIDPHQDVWSRFTGGDGAPGWTLEAAGFDMQRFQATGAAIVHATHGDPFPRMIWPTNWTKLAAGSMFTLFFAGNDLAPQTRVNGEPIQEYLQRHYIGAMMEVAGRLREFDHVVGYDTMNEPSAGFIGWMNLMQTGGRLQMGDTPTPLQAMALGAGIPQTVDVWEMGPLGPRRSGQRRIDPGGATAWQAGVEPVWRANGVWMVDDDGDPVLVRPDHFWRVKGQAVDFNTYYRPFANRYAEAIRSVDPDAIIFVEGDTGMPPPEWRLGDARDVVHAPHWYDGMVLVTKSFSPVAAADERTGKAVVGLPGRIHRSFVEQVGRLRRYTEERIGAAPTLIGETGVPFDMNDKRAYRTGDFRGATRALDRMMKVMEALLMPFTLWNYTADNTHARGDQWNDEDLSIFSRDQQTDPADINSGGRALDALLRPYPQATAGEPLELSFDYRRGECAFSFEHDPAVDAPTVLYVPRWQYPSGAAVEAASGRVELDQAAQVLRYWPTRPGGRHTIRLQRAKQG